MKRITLAKEIRLAFLLLCGACCGLFAGCEDTREDHLGEFQTRFYFRNSGEQPITLFKVGENTVYKIPICKSGHNQSGTGKVTVSVMDQEQLDIYNLSNLTNYKQLPAHLFKFTTEREFYFGPEDSYKVVEVEMLTDAISEYQNLPENVDSECVLALQVYSDGENTLSRDVNMLFIAPSIDIVRVTLTTPGFATFTYTSESPVENSISNSVRVNIDDNRWDFSCGLGVYDQAWLDEYNEKNGTEFTMLPENCYELPEPVPSEALENLNTLFSVAFAKGHDTSDFEIKVFPKDLELLKDYLLPVYITECTKEQFVIDAEQAEYLVNVRLDPDKIVLDESMITSPFTSTAEGSIAALCDGDWTSDNAHWHSDYNNNCNYDEIYGIYIDFALKEPLSDIVIKYCTRNSDYGGGARHPRSIAVGVSNDGENWTLLGEVSEGLPLTAAIWGTLPAFHSETTFTYVRFGITSTGEADLHGGSGKVPTSIGEIELYGANLLGN